MRILFVSSETPLFPAGGIATYLEYIVPSLRRAGHEVFLFTFRDVKGYVEPLSFDPFLKDNVHIELVSEGDVHTRFPSHSHFQSISFALSSKLEEVIEEWNIDVVESTDYQGPCLALYQSLQSKSGSERRLFSTFHHGLSEVIFEADQIGYPSWAKENNLAERQQMRASDLIVAPSKASAERLRSLDVRSNISLVREPYAFRHSDAPSSVRPDEVQYIGRISIQKGIDKLIYATNILYDVMPIRRFEIIGRVGFTSFRQDNILEYCRTRLRSELREKFLYSDFRRREVVLDLLNWGAMSPHLGTDETFSYACIEAIDAGQVPIVRAGTAMAEFFPEHLQHYVLDEKMRTVSGLHKNFEEIIDAATSIVEGVREYCKSTLDPSIVADNLASTYSAALDKKRGWRVHASARMRMHSKDVTVLIPAYKPNHEFMETIDSLAAQTAGVPNLLICDDGTPEDHQPWFEYAKAVFPDCKIFRQSNAGLLATRNALVEASSTP